MPFYKPCWKHIFKCNYDKVLNVLWQLLLILYICWTRAQTFLRFCPRLNHSHLVGQQAYDLGSNLQPRVKTSKSLGSGSVNIAPTYKCATTEYGRGLLWNPGSSRSVSRHHHTVPSFSNPIWTLNCSFTILGNKTHKHSYSYVKFKLIYWNKGSWQEKVPLFECFLDSRNLNLN